MKLAIYASYSIGLILMAVLIVPDMTVVNTFWFIFYLLAGIFTLQNQTYRLFYFLINILMSVLVFLAGLQFTVVLIGFFSSLGFVFSILSIQKIEKVTKKDKIRQIISEVVEQAKEHSEQATQPETPKPKIEVYETHAAKVDEPVKVESSKKPGKKAKKKKKVKSSSKRTKKK